ncbi:MAG: hypothetical protein ACJARN_001769, partial [Arenicella sp.]
TYLMLLSIQEIVFQWITAAHKPISFDFFW